MKSDILATPFGQAVADFICEMSQRGCTPRSVSRFERVLLLAGIDCGWSVAGDFDEQTASRYLASRIQLGWSESTRNSVLSVFRNFGRYLHRTGALPGNPADLVPFVSMDHQEGARALTLLQVRALVAVAKRAATDQVRTKGNRALFYAFLASTGARRSEAAKITWNDVVTESRFPFAAFRRDWARSRGSEEIPLTIELVELLTLERSRRRASNSDPVFRMCPTTSTFAKDVDAALDPTTSKDGEPVLMRSLRQFFVSWLSSLPAPPLVYLRLARDLHAMDRHSRYCEADPFAEQAVMTQFPKIWTGESP